LGNWLKKGAYVNLIKDRQHQRLVVELRVRAWKHSHCGMRWNHLQRALEEKFTFRENHQLGKVRPSKQTFKNDGKGLQIETSTSSVTGETGSRRMVAKPFITISERQQKPL